MYLQYYNILARKIQVFKEFLQKNGKSIYCNIKLHKKFLENSSEMIWATCFFFLGIKRINEPCVAVTHAPFDTMAYSLVNKIF